MALPLRIDVDELVLRVYERSDAEGLCRSVAESLEHLRPWMPWVAFEPQSVAQREEWIAGRVEAYAAGGEHVYGIFAAERLVGGTGLHPRSSDTALEIGYWVHVDFVGRGIATRASRALTDTAFGESGIEAVEIRHDRRNVASGRVPARLGYRLVEEARRAPQAPGESGVLHRWRIERRDWLGEA